MDMAIGKVFQLGEAVKIPRARIIVVVSPKIRLNTGIF
jgi:hypothetical protein